MQVLTPSGYQSPVTLANGAEVCAFDAETGAPIVNHVEHIDVVDYAEWCRWWQVEETVPAFNWIRVNGTFLLFGEQSIWRNGTNVCHAKHLVVGDEIYDDADQPIPIISLEPVTDESLVWYRFDIDGDHSYIIDGLTVHNASRYWVGGTGTWDSSTTTNWAASSNGAGGQSVPGSADTVTFDGNSGGGTCTLNFGGPVTVQSITMGAFTGTWDNSVHNNDITVTANSGFSGSGSGARTIKLGTATYTLSANSATWNFSGTTNLTYPGNTGASIVFTGSTGVRSFNGGGLSHGTVILGASSGAGSYGFAGSCTLASLNITAPNFITFGIVTTTTISGAFTWTGTSSSQIGLMSTSVGTAATIAAAAGSSASWTSFRDMTFTGTPTAASSFDLGNNSGITITPPSVGGGSSGFGVVGS